MKDAEVIEAKSAAAIAGSAQLKLEIYAAQLPTVHYSHKATRPAIEALAALRAENERLREALTPSGDTKAAYIGEFKFTVDDLGVDDEGDTFECTREVVVPWTTVKEIMAAIRTRAAIPPTPHDGLTDTSHHAGSSAGECKHEWIDARNSVVLSGELCLKCNSIRAGNAASPAPSGGEMVLRGFLDRINRFYREGIDDRTFAGCVGLVLAEYLAASPAPPHQGGKSE